MARPTKARRPVAADVKAAADRAEARAKGKPTKSSAKPIDPPIVSAAAIAKAIKRGKGQPTAYKAKYATMVAQWCADGATDTEIAQLIGVDTRTIYRWKLQHPDFCQAMSVGKDAADDRVERSFYQRAVGYELKVEKLFHHQGEITRATTVEHVQPDVTAITKWLASRRKSKWAEVNRLEHTGKDGAPIEVTDTSKLELARWIAFELAKATPNKLIEG